MQVGLVRIIFHNIAKSTQAYEKLIGDHTGAAAAEANAEQQKILFEQRPAESDST